MSDSQKIILVIIDDRLREIPNKYFIDLAYSLEVSSDSSFLWKICCEEEAKRLLPEADGIFCVRGRGVDLVESDEFFSDRHVCIVQFDDIHYRGDRSRKARERLFDLADLVFLPYYDHAIRMEEYQSYREKFAPLLFHAPGDCFEVCVDWSDKSEKILLSGRVSKSYPLRSKIYRSVRRLPSFEILSHPGYRDLSHEIVGRSYYEKIASFRASIVTSAKAPLNYLLMKYFEIPACGSVPLFEEVPGLQELGFEDGVSYLSINEDNFLERSKEALHREDIAASALRVVMEGHRFDSRLETIKDTLRERFGW